MAHSIHHTENSGSPIKNVGDDRREIGDDRREVGDDSNREETFASEEYLSKTLEVAVTKAVLQASGPTRRQLLAGVGSAALVGLISEFLPLSQLQALGRGPRG